MTSTQADIQALRQVIRQLDRQEQEELADWILNSPDGETGVAEPSVPYGTKRYFTVEEYLSLEEESVVGYEYVVRGTFPVGTGVTSRKADDLRLAWRRYREVIAELEK